MNSEIARLTSTDTDLIIRCHPFAEILYWGPKLVRFSPEDVASLQRPVANGKLDVDLPLTFAMEYGRGQFGSPGIEGHRDGYHAAPVFTTTKVDINPGAVTVTSEDELAALQLISELRLDPQTGVLQMRHTLKNLHHRPWQLHRLAVTLPVPEHAVEAMAFHGRWLREFQPHRVRLEHGGFIQESRRGRSSHEYFPAFVVGEAGFSEQRGAVWGVHLGWSGNHRLRADVKTDGRRVVQAEALYLPGEISLGEGESCSTPWVYAAFSQAGLNGMSQAYHAFLRQSLIRFSTKQTRPVHLNTWEGIYFDHDPAYIMQMASKAAEIGVERFIIDDGWFRGRNHDQAGLGDWYLDEQKYPEGLMPIIEHVKSLGMSFGIWVEPEMINPDSDLFRLHPDWVLQLPGYQQPTGRYQYVLDLNHPDVFDYLLARLSWLLSEHPVEYIKWDMNRELVQPGHQGKLAADAQTHQFYRLLDELNRRFPHVEIESCASGGGRIDYGVLERTQRFWVSDNNDALERQAIQRGMSYFFPPEVMGQHIGHRRCHATQRQHTIGFRGLTALFGHMGIELDPVQSDEDELQGYRHYIQLHKALRPLLHGGTTWRVDMPDDTIQIGGVVSQDQTCAVFMMAQLQMLNYSLAGKVRFPGLLPEAQYEVSLLDSPEIKTVREGGGAMRELPSWLRQPMVVSGDWLMQAGLALPVLAPESALLIGLKQV
ncbi:Alpha-galactosidase [Serratia plymuthica]|uniref:alpha-galactosidase n=1 Tax=Serratia plymuthica TaxID=82996 RepID=UPI00045646DF|nr:alpha-galactosidase [Serratia plymuthica]AHY07486.1 alpha-galactosidase [Serratia plymuthica]MEB6538192.1 alpha-galactosidase [Serratia plymuthica]QJW55697.1 Alpha-galactosidase [Serratia plymuthica]